MTDAATSDDLLDAVANGAGFCLVCANGHGSLPPRTVCPECGSRALEREALPETGTVRAVTTVHVGPPAFADETPYGLAIARFGPVRLTGHVRAAALDGLARGDDVTLGVGTAGDERHLRFE
ncbi:OB-fold domain-containing protein [Halarchaeum sp. CBA1220]|uniref:Zn-ribbon domain-containing OB-fold protein n=1 Tax=Halarchaeum sp. CBA1220 TaxID=1853682 RepID=UPI000F3A84D0|nr:OB-fold domain-containing protein [Halarchaeum sp. CBA1220]QLC33932.1 OB-fold domain-containing protein [Halarchaeum sp. CBA1220]